MPSPQRWYIRFKKLLVLCLLLSVSFMLMVFTDSNLMQVSESIGITVFSSFQRGIYGVTHAVSNTIHSVGELRELRSVYEEAQERLEYYKGLERQVISLREENDRLRKQLGYGESLDTESISAPIIARDPGNAFQSFIIGKGSSSGIRIGDPVVAFQEGIYGLLGRVVNCGRNAAIVKPIFETTSYIAARLDRSRYEGLVGGENGEQLEMFYVSKIAEEDILPGDLVTTSGLSSVFPEGISIGRVAEILGEDYDTSLTLKITPVLEYGRVEQVYILLSGDDE